MSNKEGSAPRTAPSKWASFKEFACNSETGEVFGRTGASWAKITIFYIIFYAFLAGFWIAMLIVFYQTLDEREPRWQLDSSRISGNPGLGFRPRAPHATILSTLVWFNATKEESVGYWVDGMNQFLEPYREEHPNRQTCVPGMEPDDDRTCNFNVDIPGPCREDKNYGYTEGHPCVAVKLNRIFKWVPVPYDENEVPDNFPSDTITYDKNNVYITCHGQDPSDKDNIGEIEFLPSAGIPSYYFPFTNQASYLSPLVFVHFKNPTKGVLINIVCRGWAKNINYYHKDKLGMVEFSLLID